MGYIIYVRTSDGKTALMPCGVRSRYNTEAEAVAAADLLHSQWLSTGAPRFPAYVVCYNGGKSEAVYETAGKSNAR